MANDRARVQRGRQSEELVAARFRDVLQLECERRPASLPGSDVMGIPGMDIEVKARRGLDLPGWLRQQAKRLEPCQSGLLVVRPDGAGPATVGSWAAVMTLDGWMDMYGELLT